jgi:hypothetical protein
MGYQSLEVGWANRRGVQMKSMWRLILNNRSAGSSDVMECARQLGYTMFAQNGQVYAVHSEKSIDPLKYPLFKVTDIEEN